MNEFKKTITDFTDKLVGDEGLQFVVTANIAPKNYMYIGLAIVGGMFVGNLLNIALRRFVK